VSGAKKKRSGIERFLRSTSKRSFVLYPLLVVGWEYPPDSLKPFNPIQMGRASLGFDLGQEKREIFGVTICTKTRGQIGRAQVSLWFGNISPLTPDVGDDSAAPFLAQFLDKGFTFGCECFFRRSIRKAALPIVLGGMCSLIGFVPAPKARA
jgi:hypothetical protein